MRNGTWGYRYRDMRNGNMRAWEWGVEEWIWE